MGTRTTWHRELTLLVLDWLNMEIPEDNSVHSVHLDWDLLIPPSPIAALTHWEKFTQPLPPLPQTMTAERAECCETRVAAIVLPAESEGKKEVSLSFVPSFDGCLAHYSIDEERRMLSSLA